MVVDLHRSRATMREQTLTDSDTNALVYLVQTKCITRFMAIYLLLNAGISGYYL
jgi:hypothetical protein